jgi:magnesium-transporting ATPase (P-type)
MSHNTQDSRFKGLTDQEVLQNRQKYGMNLLTPPKRPSIWKDFYAIFARLPKWNIRMKTDRLESLQIGHSHTKDVFNDLQICLVGNPISA